MPSPGRNWAERFSAVMTRENVEWLYRMVKPKAHNRIAWIVVAAGIGLVLSPWWEPVLRAVMKRVFGIDVDPPTPPLFGLALIVAGLGYHLFAYRIETLGERERQQASIAHDRKQVARFCGALREHDLDRFLYRMENEHAYLSSEITSVRASAVMLHSIEMHFIDGDVRKQAASFTSAVLELGRFCGRNFFVYPDRASDDPQYAMHPAKNWDRGSPTEMQEQEYTQHEAELEELVVAVRDEYRRLVASFHERLFSDVSAA